MIFLYEYCVFIGIIGYIVEENRDSLFGIYVKRLMRRERRNIKEKERKGEENEIFKIEFFFLEEGVFFSMCVYIYL